GSQRSGVARLNPDGLLDTSFAVPSDVDLYRLLALTSDGKVLALASKWVDGVRQFTLIRLNGDGSYIKLRVPASQTTGALRLSLNSQPGKTYVLEGSTNFLDWLPLRTNVATGLTLEFEDIDAANFLRRFYRAWVATP